MFPQLCKKLVIILIMHILFCRTYQKNVLQKEIKNGAFRSLFINERTGQFLIPTKRITENVLRQIVCVVPEFFVKPRRFRIFFVV